MLIGIDPGWKNLAAATFDEHKQIRMARFNPSSFKTLCEAADAVLDFVQPIPGGKVTMERYVAYQGVHNADSENILMITGALHYLLEKEGCDVVMVRAIDWKPTLCKRLYRERQFSNPSKSFDKVYSMAAARCLFPDLDTVNFSDHEADAVCLAMMRSMTENGSTVK